MRELFADAGRRPWLLLPLAPPLGFALNLVRVAYVATSDNPEALAGMQGDHTPQGLAVLGAGTAILYVSGALLAGRARRSDPPAAAVAPQPLASRTWLFAAGWLAALTLVSWAVAPFDPSARFPSPTRPLPEQSNGWTSEPLIGDPLFFGAGGHMLHRRYAPQAQGPSSAEQTIEVYVGFEAVDYPDTSMLSSKLAWPGPDWVMLRREPVTLYPLQREGRLAIAARPPSDLHAVVYTWHPGDLGLWRESLRSLLALDASPFRRERERRAVRILAFAPHAGPIVLDRAKQRLDRFVTLFREELADL